ncbi:hypothetical protein Taro_013998 [Colocasia esculenta]|uniref:Uncharacterized protein n=1 Tax=Colocasia esculenta TaxID=4460 RepID=A0A843UHQ4_COLES|nr:hypothetical protein [Colocasia esculenta]
MGLQLCVCRCGVGWSPRLFDFILVEWQLDLSSVTARLRDILSTSCASTSERSCDLECYRNDPQKTTELFSFGRPKEEKLKSHHHPQREATASTTRVSQLLVDTGAYINVVSLDTLNSCGVALQSVQPSSITVTSYDNTSSPPKGVVTLKVGLGPSITDIDFHILDMDSSFRMILGRQFIQALGVVTSTIHQCLNLLYKGRVVKVASKPTILDVDAMTDNSVPSIWPSNQLLMSVLDMYGISQSPTPTIPSTNAAKRSKIMTEKDWQIMLKMGYQPSKGLGAYL